MDSGRCDWKPTGNSATVTFNQGVQVVTANYHTSYLLTTGSTPTGAATFQFTPSSPDSFFAAGTQVTVTAVAKGSIQVQPLEWRPYRIVQHGLPHPMTSPHQVTAILDVVPFVAPTGVQNAAGQTPDGSVAPGSIISIYGSNLAAGLQRIRTVKPVGTNHWGHYGYSERSRILPLMFVSPP